MDNKKVKIGGVIIFFSLILFGVIMRLYLMNKIAENPVLVKAKIIGSSLGKPPSLYLEYEYCYNGKKFSKEDNVKRKLFDDFKKGIRNEIWIAIAKDDPKISRIMDDDDIM